jgi:hypothetical protein
MQAAAELPGGEGLKMDHFRFRLRGRREHAVRYCARLRTPPDAETPRGTPAGLAEWMVRREVQSAMDTLLEEVCQDDVRYEDLPPGILWNEFRGIYEGRSLSSTQISTCYKAYRKLCEGISPAVPGSARGSGAGRGVTDNEVLEQVNYFSTLHLVLYPILLHGHLALLLLHPPPSPEAASRSPNCRWRTGRCGRWSSTSGCAIPDLV